MCWDHLFLLVVTWPRGPPGRPWLYGRFELLAYVGQGWVLLHPHGCALSDVHCCIHLGIECVDLHEKKKPS